MNEIYLESPFISFHPSSIYLTCWRSKRKKPCCWRGEEDDHRQQKALWYRELEASKSNEGRQIRSQHSTRPFSRFRSSFHVIFWVHHGGTLLVENWFPNLGRGEARRSPRLARSGSWLGFSLWLSSPSSTHTKGTSEMDDAMTQHEGSERTRKVLAKCLHMRKRKQCTMHVQCRKTKSAWYSKGTSNLTKCSLRTLMRSRALKR